MSIDNTLKKSWIHSRTEDVVCVQETWGHTTTLKNYADFYKARKNQRGGGVAIFVKNSWYSKVVDDSIKDTLLVEASDCGNFAFFVISTYYPNKQIKLCKWNKHHARVLGLIQKVRSSVIDPIIILAGDFNDILSENEITVMDFTLPKNNQPTSIHNRRIDYILTTTNTHQISFNVEPNDEISDHFTLRMQIRLPKSYEPRSRLSIDRKKASEISWKAIAQAKNLSDFLIVRRNERDRAKIIRSIPLTLTAVPDWKIQLQLILLNSVPKQSKIAALRENYRDFCRELQNIKGKLWFQLFKSKTLKNKPANLIDSLIIDDKTEYDPKTISTAILNHYRKQHTPDYNYGLKSNTRFPNLSPLGVAETIGCMSHISQNKALAFDAVCDSIFHIEIDEKSERISDETWRRAELFRNFWDADITNSTFLTESLTGRLIPVNKIYPKTPSLNDYRPIVALSAIAKFLEARFAPKLSEYIKTNCIYSQIGFVKGCNTHINIQRLLKWAIAKKKSKPIIVFIDFKAAYDSVPHNLLFSLLRRKSVLPADEIHFIQAWYQNMKVGMLTDEHQAKSIKVGQGVIQGSLLGPALFDIFINELVIELRDSNRVNPDDMFLYADDLAIGAENLHDIQAIIATIENWAARNRMEVNKSKSAIMQIKSTRVTKVHLTTEIKEYLGYPVVTKYKYLGIIVDETLSLKDHLTYLRQKVDQTVFNFRVLGKKNFEVKNWISIYKIFVIPHILYAMVAVEATKKITKRKELLKIAVTGFKRFMGLKKTTETNLLYELLELNLSDTFEKTALATEDKWRARKGDITNNIPKKRQENSKQLLSKITWVNIQLMNLLYARCHVHNGCLLNFKHLKEHKLTNPELKLMKWQTMNSDKKIHAFSKKSLTTNSESLLAKIKDPPSF